VILPDGASASEVIAPDGRTVFGGIPDSDVYLHDDWGDNKLQNRDGSETITHNGVTGYYRPEWQILNGSPSVENGELVLDNGDEIYTEINLNFSETIVWETTGFEVPDTEETLGMTLFTDSLTHCGGWGAYSNGYTMGYRGNGDRPFRRNTDGTTTFLDGFSSVSDTADWTVTREPNGDWTIESDGKTATHNDTTHTTAKYIVIGGREGVSGLTRYSEIKVR